MPATLERLDSAVPLRYTVGHTNHHQTLTALALLYHQVNVYEQKIKNPPSGFNKWEIDINDYKAKVELAGRSERSQESCGEWSTFLHQFYGTVIHATIVT
jgi:hypothetical protein